MPEFLELVIDDEFDEHQGRAGRPIVTAREALQVWDSGFQVRRNVRGRPETRILIGQTDGGRHVTLVARDLGDGSWLTYTAWDTKASDLA